MQRISQAINWIRYSITLLLLVSLMGCLGKQIVPGGKSAALDPHPGIHDDRETSGNDSAKPGGTNLAVAPAICKELEKPCTATPAATFCELPEITGTVLVPGNRPYAFGANECEARKGVLEQVCKRGIDIKSASAIKCKAGGSGGKCPVTPRMCITVYDPRFCVATSYAGQAIPADTRLAGWGANECVAREELANIACAQNLNPDLVQGVSCSRQAEFRGDCPPLQPACDPGDNTAHDCEVGISAPGGSKISAQGASKCLARFNLDFQICLAGQSPAAMAQRVSCRQK